MTSINSQSAGDVFRQIGEISAKRLSYVNQPQDDSGNVHFHSDIPGVMEAMHRFGDQDTKTRNSFLEFMSNLTKLAQDYLAIPQDTERAGVNGRGQIKMSSIWTSLLGNRGLIPLTFQDLSDKMKDHPALSKTFKSIADGFATIGRELKGLEGTYQEPAAAAA